MYDFLLVQGGGNLSPRRPPLEYLGKHTSRGKPKILPADRILMDPRHKASKNPSDNADLGFQGLGPALHIMQLNIEGLSAAKRHIIESLAEIHHIDVICLQETHVNDGMAAYLGYTLRMRTLFRG